MTRNFIKTCVPLVLAVILLWCAGWQNKRLLEARRVSGITRADPLENTPPLVAFTTVALGGFRGIIADMLWVRSARLMTEGRYFEMVQLAEWITQLEPRFAEVWAWQSWNLAYNISVIFQNPEDRWRWVLSGISLLRDRGLFYNPASPELYHELGWLFQHKVGGLMDQAHWYYKRRWADEMAMLFDGPRPDYKEYLAVPATREELLQNPAVRLLVENMQAAGEDPFSYTLLENTNQVLRAEADESATSVDMQQGLDDLLLYLRVRRMKEEFKLFPSKMQAIDNQYGPLDWRLTQAHAIYWAVEGLSFAEGFSQTKLERMIFQNMSEAFRRGTLIVDQKQDIFLSVPNVEILPRVRHAYEEALANNPGNSSIKTAYANFLREAVLIMYSQGHPQSAKELFDVLAAEYADQGTAAGFRPFLYALITEQMVDTSPRSIIVLLEGALFQSYFWLAMGDDERAAAYRQMATLCRQQYMKQYNSAEQQERMAVPPLQQLQQQAMERAQKVFADSASRERLQGISQ